MNIPSVHVNIPPSQINKPKYNPNSFYQYKDIVRRKLTLKINAGNDKDSFNVTLHKTLRKSIFDLKKYIMERNSKYIYERQTKSVWVRYYQTKILYLKR